MDADAIYIYIYLTWMLLSSISPAENSGAYPAVVGWCATLLLLIRPRNPMWMNEKDEINVPLTLRVFRDKTPCERPSSALMVASSMDKLWLALFLHQNWWCWWWRWQRGWWWLSGTAEGERTVQPMDEVDGNAAGSRSQQGLAGSGVDCDDTDATQDPGSECIFLFFVTSPFISKGKLLGLPAVWLTNPLAITAEGPADFSTGPLTQFHRASAAKWLMTSWTAYRMKRARTL